MPIFSDDVEEVTMQVHRVYRHGICANQSDMKGLSMPDADRLSAGKALTEDSGRIKKRHPETRTATLFFSTVRARRRITLSYHKGISGRGIILTSNSQHILPTIEANQLI